MAVKDSKIEEKLLYIYRCPSCNKFTEEPTRNDGVLCSCGSTMTMSKPDETIKHYKKARRVYNFYTVLFTIIAPIITLILFMFINKPEGLDYKLPILGFVLIGAVLLKGKTLLERIINETQVTAVRTIVIFFYKNVMYLVLLGILLVIYFTLDRIGDSLFDIILALSFVTIENTIGYCFFDYKWAMADYIIKRAVRQAETIQAMEISGR